MGHLDTILRKHVFAESDFLHSATTLLHSAIARVVLMPILTRLTHLGDFDILKALSRFTSAILCCAEGQLDDLEYVESTVCVLTHSTASVLQDVRSDPELAALIPLPRIIHFFLNVVRLPTATSISFEHFNFFCSQLTCYHRTVFQSIPDSVDFVMACTPAQDVRVRNAALRALIGLCDPASPMQSAASKPPHIIHQALAHRNTENPRRSLSDFGHALIDLILRNEVGFRGYFTHQDPNAELLCTPTVYKCTRNIINGNLVTYAQDGWTNVAKTHVNISVISVENETHEMTRCPKTDHGLFFIVKNDFDLRPAIPGARIRWHQSAIPKAEKKNPPHHPHQNIVCGKIRGRNPRPTFCGGSSLLHARNSTKHSHLPGRVLSGILPWHFLLRSGDYLQARRHDRCRSPGGKGSDLTDFLREQLLHYTAIFAYHIAEDMLKGRAIEVRIQEVKNAISFINDSPPDADKMPRRIALTIHLNFLLRGHTLNDDFTELQASQNKLSLAYDIAQSRTRGFYPPPQCLAIDKIFARMPIAWKAWKPIVSRHAGHTYPAVDDPNVNLAAWLKKLDTDDPTFKYFALRDVLSDNGRTGPAQLCRCSSCSSPSAALKQCSGCLKTRYCNSECQKRHWKVHRKTCKS
ncbi:hypothetical protein C8J57DRAFT_1483389 [Mycena rebaudengoi]|nr:hypothetical protein C8J57DRAFT_1483389 [Mycena rebaudengoi]